MNVAVWLQRTASLSPSAPALFRGALCVADYRTFASRAHRLAFHFQIAYRLTPGDRVALIMGNCVEYFEILYGLWIAGLVAVPVNAKLHPKEAAWIVADAGARLVFVTADLDENLRASLGVAEADLIDVITVGSAAYVRCFSGDAVTSVFPSDPQDTAWLFYTSGTTGRPKGVMLTHGNLAAMTACYFMDVDSVDAGDASLYAAPLSHGAGLYHFPHLIRGARHVVPQSGKFDPAEILDLSARLRNTSMFVAPTMVRRLANDAKERGQDGDGVKTIVYGGAPMYQSDIDAAMTTLGQRFVQIYGQGESPMTITALSRALHGDRQHPNWRKRLASVGVAQSLVDVRVAGEDGRPLPVGETGEVQARGPSVMAGYWRRPDATVETLRDGWLCTGDLGEMDQDGFLTLRDRSKDVIISGGSNIYPREVEEVLLQHPAVLEAAVIGVPHADWGEEVVAYIVTQPDMPFETGDLDTLCLENIARFKRPKRYVSLDNLPKSNYGKILKSELRRWQSETP